MKNDILLTKIYNNLEATGAVKNLADSQNSLTVRDTRGVPPVALKWVPPVAGK